MSVPYQLKAEKPLMNVIIYGDQGTGKTVLAASAMGHPDLDEVLFCNLEGGLLSIAGKHPRAIDLGRDEKTGMTNGKAFEDLDAVIDAIAARRPGFEKIRTVVIDSGTEFQAQDLEAIKKAKGRGDEAAEFADYNKNTTRMRRIFRTLRDIKVNVIITALTSRVFKEGSDKLVEVKPQFTKAVGESIMGFVDFCWFLSVDAEGNRVLLTAPSGPYRVKTRSPEFAAAIGKVVKDPDLGKLYTQLCTSVKEIK